MAAFGYYAGFAGSAMGIDLWCHQQLNGNKPYGPIEPFPNEDLLITHVKSRLEQAKAKAGKTPDVMVMGALGRCGSGAADFARRVGIPEEQIIKWDMAETAKGGPFEEILKHEIFVNSIYLSKPIPPFLTKQMLDGERRLTVLVDVSCDTTNPHNPLPVYEVATTFDKPVLSVKSANPLPMDVIAIDHLPTLLPREASDMFVQDLLPTLKQLKNEKTARVWTEAAALYSTKVGEMKADTNGP